MGSLFGHRRLASDRLTMATRGEAGTSVVLEAPSHENRNAHGVQIPFADDVCAHGDDVAPIALQRLSVHAHGQPCGRRRSGR